MRRTPLLTLLAVLALALAGVGAAATPTASFAEDGPETSQHGTVTMTIDVEDTDRAVLRVGLADHGYVLNATVVDDDGDGTAAVTFDAANAGTADTTLSAAEGDAVTVDHESELASPPLDAGVYDLELAVDGNTTDVDRLQVRDLGNGTTTQSTATETATGSTTETGDSQSSNGTVPGLGPLGALAAVVAAALVAVRR